MLLLGDECGGRLSEGAGGLRAREEVDVDAAHAAATELDIARAASSIGARRLAAPKCGEQGSGDAPRRPLREDACLGYSDCGDVPDRVYARILRLEGARAHRHVTVHGHTTCDDDVGGAVLGDAQEQVEGHLAAIVKHGHAAAGVERTDATTGNELNATLGEGGDQRLRRLWRWWHRRPERNHE